MARVMCPLNGQRFADDLLAGINKEKEEEAAAPVNKRSKRPAVKPPSADPAVSLSESETIRLVNQPEAGRPPSDRRAANDRS